MTIYKYDISMTYIYNNAPITFKAENFHNLLIDYDYDEFPIFDGCSLYCNQCGNEEEI